MQSQVFIGQTLRGIVKRMVFGSLFIACSSCGECQSKDLKIAGLQKEETDEEETREYDRMNFLRYEWDLVQ